MSYDLYTATIPLIKDAVNSLSAILKKAEEHPKAASFAGARLIEDMHPLTFQVHCVTDITQKTVARISGKEPENWEDNLTSFADFHARIAQALEILDKADKDTINKRAQEMVTLGLGPGRNVELTSHGYASGYGLPNIFFHLMAAYSILRKEGVPVGKRDYLTPFMAKHVDL